MSEDTEHRCIGFEVGNGDYILSDPDDTHAWIRSDTVVTLASDERAQDSTTRLR